MKINLLVLTISAVLSITACSSKDQKQTSQQKTESLETENNIQKSDKKMAKPIHLTKAEFLQKVANYEANPDKWVYLGDKPCIIDFYADWCGPCKMVAPILEELAQEYDGQIYIYKVDTEQEQELAGVFGIQSIPTILFIPMNDKPQITQGALPKTAFKNLIDSVLLKK